MQLSILYKIISKFIKKIVRIRLVQMYTGLFGVLI